jgi:hypothetical protein
MAGIAMVAPNAQPDALRSLRMRFSVLLLVLLHPACVRRFSKRLDRNGSMGLPV